MDFHFGPWVYTVKISEGKLFDDQNVERNGLCVFNDREIWLSGELKPECRLETLKHELWHAFCRHYGRPQTEEDMCNAVATWATDMHRQIQSQGGELALRLLTSNGIVDDQSNPAGRAVFRTVVCKCRATVPPSHVHSTTPEYHEQAQTLAMRRTFYCQVCDRVYAWMEGATDAGLPNGTVIVSLTRVVGEAEQQWLAEHAEETGVIVR